MSNLCLLLYISQRTPHKLSVCIHGAPSKAAFWPWSCSGEILQNPRNLAYQMFHFSPLGQSLFLTLLLSSATGYQRRGITEGKKWLCIMKLQSLHFFFCFVLQEDNISAFYCYYITWRWIHLKHFIQLVHMHLHTHVLTNIQVCTHKQISFPTFSKHREEHR